MSQEIAGGPKPPAPNDATAAGKPALVILPTDDPKVANALWNDGGTIRVSAG